MKIPPLTLLVLSAVAVFGVEVASAQEFRSARQNAEFHRAETAWRSGGSLLEAKARLDELITGLPADAQALKLRAKILLAMGRSAEAFRDAQKAAGLAPDDGEANLLLTRAARLAGDSTVALEALKRAESTIPSDAISHVHLSIESMQLGRYEESESLARVAVALDPKSGEARMQLARALAVRGNVSAAVMALRIADEMSLLEPGRVAADSILTATGVSAQFASGVTPVE